jgi:hypothetical protein
MNQFYSNNNKKLLASIHKLNCMLGALDEFTDQDVVMEYVLVKEAKGDFHISRGIKDEKCSTLVCRICGNDKLIVGQIPFFTSAKCDTCNFEIGIHEG